MAIDERIKKLKKKLKFKQYDYEAALYEIDDLIRVILQNPDDLYNYIRLNHRKSYDAYILGSNTHNPWILKRALEIIPTINTDCIGFQAAFVMAVNKAKDALKDYGSGFHKKHTMQAEFYKLQKTRKRLPKLDEEEHLHPFTD